MAKYRKKPIVIEAYQTEVEFDIETLEGTHHASVGDWIITGVKGERYPCKPDIFQATYEKVEDVTVNAVAVTNEDRTDEASTDNTTNDAV